MSIFFNKLARLVDVKSILSLVGAIIFAILAVKGILSTENIMVLLTMIFQSFFGYQNTKATNTDTITNIKHEV